MDHKKKRKPLYPIAMIQYISFLQTKVVLPFFRVQMLKLHDFRLNLRTDLGEISWNITIEANILLSSLTMMTISLDFKKALLSKFLKLIGHKAIKFAHLILILEQIYALLYINILKESDMRIQNDGNIQSSLLYSWNLITIFLTLWKVQNVYNKVKHFP